MTRYDLKHKVSCKKTNIAKNCSLLFFQYSVKSWLLDEYGLSLGALELLGTFLVLRPFFDVSLVDHIIQECTFETSKLQAIKKGDNSTLNKSYLGHTFLPDSFCIFAYYLDSLFQGWTSCPDPCTQA